MTREPSLDLGRRRLGLNTLWNLLGQGLPLLVALAAVPVLLRGLGEARFGVLGLVWMFVALFGELGFGRAGTRFAAQALGSGRPGHVRRIVGMTLAAQAALGLVVGVALTGLSGVLVGRILSVDAALVAEARASFLIVAAAVPVLTVGAGLRGVLEAAQRFGGLNTVRFTVSTLSYLVPLVALLMGMQLVGIVALLMLIRLAGTVGWGWLARPIWSGRPAPEEGAPPGFGEILGFGAWVTVSTVVSPVLVYLDRFLLGALVSVAAVGVYTAPYEVVTRILLIPAAVAGTLFPAVSALRGWGRERQLRWAVWTSTGAVLGLVGPLVAAIVLFAEPLLGLWLGDASSPEMVRALQLLAPGVLANALAFVPFSVLQGIGRADLTGTFHLLELPIHGVLAWLLIGRFGIAGAAAAWSIRTSLDLALLGGAAWSLGRTRRPRDG